MATRNQVSKIEPKRLSFPYERNPVIYKSSYGDRTISCVTVALVSTKMLLVAAL